ncbi:serine hydrolase domain-containing protein [Leucobacter sp. UT-8R-CII-1-4]|uniref:serine hydrolase domain-containing protein n=1 Tax=Leucobacter sp. UT-8R-CII-1-4 TaxID=3040075 RepID=UPI0024A8ABB7|nr:serine hydrolase domain-containing protein [Leucobacter sp. UT-8R-CII-1-4]MDI6022589.1 serine hydrolase domain-containing protein [Leucobacter sp. UT-8R-CII-1-4]
MQNRNLDELLDLVVSPGSASAVTVIAMRNGEEVARAARGITRAWDQEGTPSTVAGSPVQIDTLFDLASITKPIVATTLLTELNNHSLTPELPLAELLPEFRAEGLRGITAAQLLSHTAGFAPSWHDHSADPGAERFRATARPIELLNPIHQYSCLGFIWAGILAETLGNASLDQLVSTHVLDPLGMHSTGYRPLTASAEPRALSQIVATEYQEHRGMVHGEVHDETAHALGGVSGNAGLFSTAPDLIRFAEALRTGTGIAPEVHHWLTEPIAGGATPDGYTPTLGLRSNETWTAAVTGRTVSHAGFTGTIFLAEPGGERSLALLSNRVHPTREQMAMPNLRPELVAAAFA